MTALQTSQKGKCTDLTQQELQIMQKSLFQNINELPTLLLTSEILDTTSKLKTIEGYIFNTKIKRFLTVDKDNKWIYASSITIVGALKFQVYSDSNKNTVVTAQLGPNNYYLNWRTSTGAVKMYDSYNTLIFKGWNKTTFKIYAQDEQQQFMGTKKENVDLSLESKQMYFRKEIYNTQFQFHYFDRDTLTAQETKKLKTYLKLYADLGAGQK